jgi:hypothetical protein
VHVVGSLFFNWQKILSKAKEIFKIFKTRSYFLGFQSPEAEKSSKNGHISREYTYRIYRRIIEYMCTSYLICFVLFCFIARFD